MLNLLSGSLAFKLGIMNLCKHICLVFLFQLSFCFMCRAFIDFIIQNTIATNSSFHLIGHSAGAHVVGGAGKSVTMGTLARISGCQIKIIDRDFMLSSSIM